MKKRLDIQSLLEDCKKEDLIRFLRTRFAKNKDLANDFLIHFAYLFELNEDEFYLVTDRIRRMFPKKLSSLTHSKARTVRNHINDLLEQTRDSHSRQDYRQAFIVASHIILLLDDYTDQIQEKYGFIKLQDKSYQLLEGILKDSPAPSLKSEIYNFLKKVINHGKAIPFQNTENAYRLLLHWKKDHSIQTASYLHQAFLEKHTEFPEYHDLWLSQQVEIVIALNQIEDLISLLSTHADDPTIYKALKRYLPKKGFSCSLHHELSKQYEVQQNRLIKSMIYQILLTQSSGNPVWLQELSIKEYLDTGNMVILEMIIQRKGFDKSNLVDMFEQHTVKLKDHTRFRLYTAYRFLGRSDVLKGHLLKEDNVFDILPFLGEIYPEHRVEVQDKLWSLIETYLNHHFGRPAIEYVDHVLDEMNQLGLYGLQNFLIRKIRHSFGHRKHFHKLMKELVQ